MTALSLPLWAMLIGTPVFIAIGQVLFKVSSGRLADSQNHPLVALALDPVFLLALALYGSATLVWIYVLRTVPLAFAYSFMALTFVLVPIFAALWLGETLTVKYMIGAGLIIAGLLVVQA